MNSKFDPEQLSELELLDALREVEINTADIPEVPEDNWRYLDEGSDWSTLRKELPETVRERLDAERQRRQSLRAFGTKGFTASAD